MTDPDLVAALSDPQVVALTLWGEARGSSAGLRAAVGSVVLNRVKAQHGTWGHTAREVCLKPWQFSCWKVEGGAANHAALMDVARHLLRGELIGPILRHCLALGAEVCTGVLPDSVHTATMYYAPDAMVPPGKVPPWAVGLSPVAVIDGTHFYRSW